MSFDPEEVQRYDSEAGRNGDYIMRPRLNGEYVESEDYDQLLEMYRAQRAVLADTMRFVSTPTEPESTYVDAWKDGK